MRKSLGIFLIIFAITAGFFGLRRVSAGGSAFSFSGTAFATGQTAPTALAVSDFNKDGAPDVAVTTNGGIVEFKGQFASGQANGALGNVQTSTFNFSCGVPQNIAIGSNQQRFYEAPVLYGTVSNADSMYYLISSSGFPTTNATCSNSLTPGGNYNWLGTADFDSDGISDAVMVKNTGFIYLSHGAFSGAGLPTFNVSVALPNSLTNATTVITGDFNGDGRPDVIAGAGNSVAYFPAAAVALGSGLTNVFSTGTATSVLISSESPMRRLLLADATGDGKSDIVVTTAASVHVIPGNNDGTFGTQIMVTLPPGASGNATAVADFNGDGFPDLVVAATGPGGSNAQLLVYPGNGSGFDAVQTIPIGSNSAAALSPMDVVAMDMNRDGRMDLVTSTSGDGNVWVLLNNAPRLVITNAGNLQFNAVIGQASPTPAVVTIGTSDLGSVPSLSVVASPLGSALGWVNLSASGNQVTIAPNISGAPGTGVYRGMAAVSGANYTQVLIPYTVTIVQQTGTVIRGGESGTAATGLVGAGGGFGPSGRVMGIADFNGDGIPDIAAPFNFNCTTTYAGVYTRKSDGTGYNAPTCATGAFTNNNGANLVLTGDFNLDGKQDALFISGNGVVNLVAGDGTGALAGAGWWPISLGANAGVVADLNADGAPDAVITSAQSGGTGGITIMLNNGAGGFSLSTLRSGHHYYSVVVADFNGDGIPDIAARNQSSAAEWGLELFLGLGGGRFGAPQSVSFFIDCAGSTAQCTRPTAQSGFAPSTAMVAGDFNGDGHPDLIFIDNPDSGQPLQPAVVVALASVDAGHNVTFSLSSQGPILVSASQPPFYLSSGDLDGDGKLDIVFSKTGFPGAVSIQFGNGDGTFGNEKLLGYTSLSSTEPTRLVDLDGDGRLDIIGPVVAGDFSNTAVAFFMGSRVPTSLAFNGAPASSAALTSANIAFVGTLTLTPSVSYPIHWVRNTTVPITFYDTFPTSVGTAVPTLTGANTMVGTSNATVSIGTHAFEARFPGDNRLLAPANTGVYAPGVVFFTQPSNTTIGTAMSPSPVVRVLVPGGSSTDSSFNGPVSIGLDHGSFSPGVITTVTASNGFATFSNLKIAQGGTFYLTAMAGSTLANSNNFNVTGGPPAHLVITGLNSNVTAGVATSFTVQMQDAGGSPAGNYTGTVHFTSSDGGATLPVNYTFTAGDLSTKTFNATFTTAGLQSITATDTSNSAFTATANTTVGAAAPASVTLNSPGSTGINTAFSALTATVKDQFNNPIQSANVTFATTPGGTGSDGTFTGGNTGTTDASGVATKTITANGNAGTFTVTANAGSINSAPRTLTITTGSVASLVVLAGSNQSTTVGTSFATQFQVKALDSGSNPVPGYTVTFTSPASGASCGYPSSNTTSISTDGNGVATVSCVANGTQGIYSVTASGNGVSPVTITSLTNQAGSAATLTVVAGSPQSAVVNAAFATAFQVKLTDAGTNPIAGQTITFTAPGSGATGNFSGSATATATTNASGIATAPAFTAGTQAGSYQVTASALSLNTGLVVTNTAGPAALMTITAGNNQSTAVRTAFPTALGVKVSDQYQNPLSGIAVTFAGPGSGASGSFAASATVNTNASGIATAPAFTANSTPGTYQVTATAGSLSQSFSLSNLAGAAANLTIVGGNGQSTTIGTAFATALSVKVTDTLNNPLQNVAVTFTPPSSGASGTFASSATVNTDAAGIATAPVYTANTVAGANAPRASVGALSQTFSLTNLPGPAATITPTGTPQTAVISQPYATPFSVRIADASNNPISGQSVTFTAPASGATGRFPGSSPTAAVITGANGVATAPTFTANGTTGTFVVTAVGGSLSANFNLTNILLQSAGIAVFSGSGQGTLPNTPFQSPLVARVFDANGNGVPNATVTFTLPGSGASATFAGGGLTYTTTTDSQGLGTSAPMTANLVVGNYNATAATGAYSTTFALSNNGPVSYSVFPQVLIFRWEVGTLLPPAQTASVVSPQNAFSFTVDSPWVKAAARPNGRLNDTISVSVDPTGMAPGNYTGMITIGDGAFLRISLQVVPPPQIVPNTRSLTFEYTVGDPTPGEQLLYVTAYTRNFSFVATPVQSGPEKQSWLQIAGGGGSMTTPSALHVGVAPAGLDPGTYEGAVHIVAADATNSPLDIRVTLIVRAAPKTPELNAVVNAASSQNGPVASNEIATLYGKNLTCPAGPQILVNDDYATVLAATDGQINFVLPATFSRTPAMVQFRCGTASAGPLAMQVAPQFPGLFVHGGSQVAAYNEGFVLNSADAPAARGSVLMLFGTGFGSLAGMDQSGLQWLATIPTVTIGGVAAEVLFAGAAPGLPGVTQINVRIPAEAAIGTAAIVITQGGVQTQAGLTATVQ
jgi:uncharacterized protein (TIGR03437 family)